MNILKSVAIAFSMYSRIPMPLFEWKKENMKYSICFFPFVGLVIALIMSGAYFLFDAFFESIPYVARTLFILVVPIIISGGIHLDGYMDTCDALSSFRDREKRLEILSDPHIGAFAVIRLLVYGCLFFAAALCIISYGLKPGVFFSWTLIFFFSRILSGIAVVSFKCAKSEGTLYTFANGAEKTKCRIALVIEGVICVFLMIYFGKTAGLFESLISFIAFIYYYHMSGKKFGGITGDLAGFFVCICELCAGIGFVVYMTV
ncbi:MAG: adenosylcobinamide-GDP ribazoletransferase [Butyrivibrio sp.]|uniref:adenosylcobinamide-GDP ribazoletransferase n=1 Tax=Butyrivibrio sp. TaxID=28121 RepID=UPI001B186196|nr:adenosylcobinamide-GDP ribazoletransferase [Butyrivibrio sp.]MBO6240805.1 adenosylcobinamide-GDP ribazoletransferase [Butyrivibrio sp.]